MAPTRATVERKTERRTGFPFDLAWPASPSYKDFHHYQTNIILKTGNHMTMRLSAILIMSSALGACTTLGACGSKQTTVVPSGGGGQRVTMDQARLLAIEPFAGPSRWYAVMNYAQGREVVLVSDPTVAGGSERRLVRLNAGDGYVVSRILTTCPRGAYVVRDARGSKTDAGQPKDAAQPSAGLDIRNDMAAICARTAKLPTFEGRLSVAVAKGRRLNAALANERPADSAAAEAKLKADPRAPETRVIRLPDRRPQPK